MSPRGWFDRLSEQRRLVYLAVALLSAAGVWAMDRLPSAIYPELTFPRITIVAQGSSLGARQVVFAAPNTRSRVASRTYGATTSIENDPGIIGARGGRPPGVAAGTGPYSTAIW